MRVVGGAPVGQVRGATMIHEVDGHEPRTLYAHVLPLGLCQVDQGGDRPRWADAEDVSANLIDRDQFPAVAAKRPRRNADATLHPWRRGVDGGHVAVAADRCDHAVAAAGPGDQQRMIAQRAGVVESYAIPGVHPRAGPERRRPAAVLVNLEDLFGGPGIQDVDGAVPEPAAAALGFARRAGDIRLVAPNVAEPARA